MLYAICNMGMIPLRATPSHSSEMLSQLLYGETCQILEEIPGWCKVQVIDDATEAWAEVNQIQKISESQFKEIHAAAPELCTDLVEFLTTSNNGLTPITLGAHVNAAVFLDQRYSGSSIQGWASRKNLLEMAFLYLNAPFLWGGKTPFGIDASGFTQMVYKFCGIYLPRRAAQQVKMGESLSFIEESTPGDLVFFDNSEGEINHVGILMNDNYVIHAYGKVRIDRIDQSGIYNVDTQKHTHHLRVIKKLLP